MELVISWTFMNKLILLFVEKLISELIKGKEWNKASNTKNIWNDTKRNKAEG